MREAYEYARKVHDGRHRDSGELYIEHDLAVAQIVAALGVNDHTLVAALLHDILLPHTGQDEKTLFQLFGPRVATLVVGFTHLQTYTEQPDHWEQAKSGDSPRLEQIRRAILSMIEQDVRIILIALADSLQDMRKASTLNLTKRQEIASHVMNVSTG